MALYKNMKKYTNYPLFENTWNFDIEQILSYLNTFCVHKTEILTYNLEEGILISDHRYEDGLHMQIYWSLNDSNIPLDNTNTIVDLLALKEQKRLKTLYFDYLAYSKYFDLTDINICHEFIHFLNFSHKKAKKKKSKKLMVHDYLKEEFITSEKINISDNDFNELIESTSKLILFEKFLKEHDKK